MNKLAIATVVAALTVGIAGCTTPLDAPSPQPTTTDTAAPSATPASGFAVTSADFKDGDELEDWATANAYNGQCVGDNLNPALEWTGAPSGTQSYVITMIDRGGGNYIHWVQFDIPGDVSQIARGASADTGGIEGDTDETPGYFGPCPPGPDHRYEFTVYALDATLGLAPGASLVDVMKGIDEHELAEASISGMRSGPAS